MKRYINMMIMLMIAIASWAAKAPTDEQLKDFCRSVGVAIQNCENEEARLSAFNKEAESFAKTSDISKIAAQQVDLLFETGGATLDKLLRIWLEPTLQSRSKNEAIFAFYAWKYLPENDNFMHGEKETATFIAFLNAKDLQKTVADNGDIAVDVFNAMVTMKDANWHTDGFVDGMKRFMECKLSDQAVMECVKVFNSVARVDTIDADIREHFRKACLTKYSTLASSIDSPRKQKACKEQMKYLEGPFACGTLVGNKAPELHFLSSPLQTSPSGGFSQLLSRFTEDAGDGFVKYKVTKLSDFYLSPSGEAEGGPVIMLDFWGTKCVPCLQSFPEVAEMQKHFEGKDVVILGVTSLQGYFIDTPNKRTIQCRNNPDKEMSLFPDYMKAMGMTWTVGISEEDVMNTDYGALAIPHIVIIDKQGNVRHNAVNADKETKIKLIEELL
ncbi:MAG: TlpA family protein disulfide reductase [Prevotella sp.]|nr:TlpA family protein disulfide reductase [Prevotella sp.]